MTLRERSAASMLRDLDRIEEDVVAPAVDRAVRSFVDTVNTAANYGIRQAPTPESIVAALTPGAEKVWPLTVGTLSSWWETFVNDHVIAAVRKRSEEHTSELQSLLRISYAVFCLKKK